MSNNKQKASWWIIIAFMIVPLVTSLVSTIHVISFFELSNYATLALILAVAFELGALSSLAGLVAMDKISKSTVWAIFVLLTIFQMMGNTYYAYDTTTSKMAINAGLIKNFTELFGFDVYDASDVIFVKRIIAIFSGAILPVISLCFLHLLVSYVIKSSSNQNAEEPAKDEDELKTIETPIEMVTVPIVGNENNTEEGFTNFLENKKKKLEKDKANYSELLRLWYKDGSVKQGEELSSYPEFIETVGNKYSTDTIKIFLTLCHYLDISLVNGKDRVASKSYDDAKIALENYLSLDTQK